MTLPTLLLAFLLATLYGALFHLWRDGGFGRLLLYLLLSYLGFGAGALLAYRSGWALWPVGVLDVGTASLGSVFFLFAGHYLSVSHPPDGE